MTKTFPRFPDRAPTALSYLAPWIDYQEPFTLNYCLHMCRLSGNHLPDQVKLDQQLPYSHAQTALHCNLSTCDGVILLCCKLNTQVCGLKASLGSRPSRHAQPSCFALRSTLDLGTF